MGTFYLKKRDTRPIMDVTLKNPDGTIYDLTGNTATKLHILLSDGTRLVRTMVVQGAPTLGTLRYTWVTTDWDVASAPDTDGSFTIGGLVASPTRPLAVGVKEHRMEYEVIGPSSVRATFPNGGPSPQDDYDILRIAADVGQG